VLAFLEDPRIITGLSSSGNVITLQSFLSGRPAATASLNAVNVHIFIVTTLAVVLAIPSGSRRRLALRLAASVILLYLYTLSLITVQMMTVAQGYAVQNLGLSLHSISEERFFDWANRGLIMVGMVLLPSFIFLIFYVSSLRQTPGFEASGRPTASPTASKTARPRGSWALAAVLCAACLMLAAVLLMPAGSPSFEEIRAGLERVVALNPGSDKAQFALGLALEDQGSPSEALVRYEKAVLLNPSLTAGWFNQGNIQFKRGEYREAQRCYETVLRLDARHGSAYNNLGDALFKQGLYDQAERNYRMALEIEPNRASSHKNLGEALLHLQRRCDALTHLQRSIELERALSEDARLQARVAALREECGQSQESRVMSGAYPASR